MCALLAVLGVGVTLACNDRGNPPPQFNGPVSVGEGAGMPPIRLTKRDKASLTGSAGTTETPAAASSGSGTGSGSATAAVVIDDSTPEALANTFLAVLRPIAWLRFRRLWYSNRRRRQGSW